MFFISLNKILITQRSSLITVTKNILPTLTISKPNLMKTQNKWPKKPIKLTKKQKQIQNEFVKYWHQVLPKKYHIVEIFNHKYPIFVSPSHGKTLEIGSGLGEHISYEHLNKTKYYALELRNNMSTVIKKKFPQVHTITGDCQKKTKFKPASFDRIIAIHLLEHLPNLPKALKEVHRLLKLNGKFVVVIPCEGGLLYKLARKISAERIFEKRYKQKYDWFIKSEHINLPNEIMEELLVFFDITQKTYFPFLLPFTNINLCIGITLKKNRT